MKLVSNIICNVVDRIVFACFHINKIYSKYNYNKYLLCQGKFIEVAMVDLKLVVRCFFFVLFFCRNALNRTDYLISG